MIGTITNKVHPLCVSTPSTARASPHAVISGLEGMPAVTSLQADAQQLSTSLIKQQVAQARRYVTRKQNYYSLQVP